MLPLPAEEDRAFQSSATAAGVTGPEEAMGKLRRT